MASSHSFALKSSGICFLLIGLAMGCEAQDAPAPEVVPRVRTFSVGEHSKGQLRRISGQLAAADTSVLSFGISGTIERINVSEGQEIHQGQVLAALDLEPLRLNLRDSRAQLAIARAQLLEAKSNYERAKKLEESAAVSQANVDAATARYRSARATLRSVQADVELRERDLVRGSLRSPFDGQVVRREAEPFQEVRATTKVFVIQTDGALVVEVNVPETLIRNVDYGQPAQVTFPTLRDVELTGIVSQVGAQVGAGNAFPVEIQLPASNEDLRVGMSAHVAFNFDAYLEDRTVFLIPLSAIAVDAGRSMPQVTDEPDGGARVVPVFVLDPEQGRLELRPIKIGDLRGNFIEVYDGLREGDQVVSAGVGFLRAGMAAERWSRKQGLRDE